MILRYARPEMLKIWSDENKFQKMLEIELLVCEALLKQKMLPKRVYHKIKQKAKIDINRIKDIEKIVKHEVIAFIEQIGEKVGPEARYIHLGLTSSDVLDTALSIQLIDSCKLLLTGLGKLLQIIKKLAVKYKNTPMFGRTHGMYAEPITFGFKLLGWYTEVKREIALLKSTMQMLSYGKISGAVGTYAHVRPEIEKYVCKKLKLQPEPVSTQILSRERYALYLAHLAIVAGTLEKFALEIRHLQRSEVGELEEPFTSGQKGSSAMPHKRNPILSENICGLSRLMRSYVQAGLENIPLWHERDISHSSAERVILPDASILLDFMINRMCNILTGLKVYPEKMLANILSAGETYFSQVILLKLIEKGLSREKAYRIVQENSFVAKKKKTALQQELLKNREVRKYLSEKEIKALFDKKIFFKHINTIFSHVLC